MGHPPKPRSSGHTRRRSHTSPGSSRRGSVADVSRDRVNCRMGGTIGTSTIPNGLAADLTGHPIRDTHNTDSIGKPTTWRRPSMNWRASSTWTYRSAARCRTRSNYGVRGVGETPIVAPLAALSNAVRDQLGFRIDDLPLSPPRVLEAIDERGGGATDPSELSHATSKGNQQPRATFGRGILTGLLLAVLVVLSGTTLPAASATDEDCPPGVECVRVVGLRITCEDGWICSDGAPPMLSLDCWRDITAIWNASISGEFRESRDGKPHKGTDLDVPNGTPV